MDCAHYDKDGGWCKISIDWSDPMPRPIYCDGKCEKYKKVYPYEGCEHAEYIQACGIWCNKIRDWVSTMSGESTVCHICECRKTD